MRDIGALALNRASLGRQMLLARSPAGADAALTSLAGLNAQHALSPYVSLWSRCEPFSPEDLEAEILTGRVVKATLMRGTLHLVSRSEYPALWRALEPARRRAFASFFPREARLLDEARLVALVHERLSAGPILYRNLEAHLAPHFPDLRPTSLSFAAKCLAPIVQLPLSGLRGHAGAVTYGWLGVEDAQEPVEDAAWLVRRYLASFGPASAQDVQQWSGLPAADVRQAIAAAGDLLRLRGDDGAEVWDIQGAPQADVDTPAPPRLLPRWDNLLLAYRDRARALPEPYRGRVIQRDGRVLATFLVDGFVAGTWDSALRAGGATLTLSPFETLRRDDEDALAAEAAHLCAWLHPGAKSHTSVILRSSASG